MTGLIERELDDHSALAALTETVRRLADSLGSATARIEELESWRREHGDRTPLGWAARIIRVEDRVNKHDALLNRDASQIATLIEAISPARLAVDRLAGRISEMEQNREHVAMADASRGDIRNLSARVDALETDEIPGAVDVATANMLQVDGFRIEVSEREADGGETTLSISMKDAPTEGLIAVLFDRLDLNTLDLKAN